MRRKLLDAEDRVRLSRSTLTRGMSEERAAAWFIISCMQRYRKTVTMAILVTTPTGAASQTDEDSQVSMQVSMLEKSADRE